MPRIRIRVGGARPEPATEPATETPKQDEGGFSLGKALLGGGALALAGVIAHKPSLIGKVGSVIGDIRQQAMLSGFALPKSVLGNVGAAGIASAERGSMRPLKELFSRETAKDIAAAYRRNTPYGTTKAVQAGQLPLPGMTTPATNNFPSWMPTPGRIMGAFDEGAQGALQRAGLSADDAAREVLQAPLPTGLAEALDSPAARYAIPFRRTPFNQFLEGLKTIKPANIKANPKLFAGVTGAGAVHGALTSEDRYPVSIGFGTAAASRYGVPYAGGAILGRMLAGGKTGGSIAGTMLPVSEYGLESSLTDPTRPFIEPAALRALQRLASGGDY